MKNINWHFEVTHLLQKVADILEENNIAKFKQEDGRYTINIKKLKF